MAYNFNRNKIHWTFSGFDTQAEAEKYCLEQEVWFKASCPDWKSWEIATSAYQTVNGFSASFEANKVD